MSELRNEVRFPKHGGAARARKGLNDLLRKEPSDELVKIIEEVTHTSESNQIKRDIQKDEDIAARPYRSPEAGV
jgi:hypothetical protein